MLNQDQIQVQKQKIDPKIILANSILQLSSLELEQAISQELEENPALELADDEPCSGCEVHPFACWTCRYKKQSEDVPRQDSANADESVYDFSSYPEEDEDPLGRIRAEVTLHDYLRQQLRNSQSDDLYRIGKSLIDYINSSGYLEFDTEEIMAELGCTVKQLAAAISMIQEFDPPGVGARNLKECLLIQMRYLAEDGLGNPIAERIIEECWDDVAVRRIRRISKRLQVNSILVRQALEFIQVQLNPFPAAGFRVSWDYNPSNRQNTIRPDVIIHRTATGYEIEIAANEHLSLTVNPQYAEVYNSIRSSANRRRSKSEDVKYIIDAVERAELFIQNLVQRRKTLRNITKCIVEYQHGFLSTGSKMYMRPLTRAMVAELIGIHESTVSRATASKYVQIPSQEVIPFDLFFQPAQTIKDMIAQIISKEDPSHPYSDQQIADILAKKGFLLSRRAVTKHRKAERVLSSRKRKRLD